EIIRTRLEPIDEKLIKDAKIEVVFPEEASIGGVAKGEESGYATKDYFLNEINNVLNIINDFKKKIDNFIVELDEFLKKADEEISDFKLPDGLHALTNGQKGHLEEFHQATYSWQDKRGWHHVRVEVTSFKIPFPTAYCESWCFETCTELKQPRGDFAIIIRRYDEDKDTKFWKFRYGGAGSIEDPNEAFKSGGIKVETIAHFGPHLEELKIKKTR
ncbi:MAG: hypothetical protein AB1472_04195, partial [Candidatus Omnitrophota bacterium]